MKFNANNCLDHLLDTIKNDISLVRNNVNLPEPIELSLFEQVLYPALFEKTQWDRISTRRPGKEENSQHGAGTNKEIRTYENNVWIENNYLLTGQVITESEEFLEVIVLVKIL